MPLALRTLSHVLLALLAVWGHLLVRTALPYPLSSCNLLLVVVLCLLIFRGSTGETWGFILVAVFFEALTTSLPPPVVFASYGGPILLIAWLLQRLLTNRSVYIVLFLGAAASTMFVGIQLLLEALLPHAPGLYNGPLRGSELSAALWSVGLTTVLSVAGYLFVRMAVRKINPAYVEHSTNPYA